MQDYFVLLVNGLTGLLFLIIGWIFLKNPPKKINHLYGYRTPQSMSSQKKWTFSQTYSAKLMSQLAVVMIIIGLFDLFVTFSSTWSTILGIAPTIIVCALLFYLTETKMRQIK